MRQLVLESLAACDIPLADDASPMPVEQIASDIETLYQALKVSLLARSGGGGMRVEAMERNLARIQQMRRCAEASWKARRRLERWFLFLETNDRPESTPAMPARQDGVAAMLPDPAVDLRQ